MKPCPALAASPSAAYTKMDHGTGGDGVAPSEQPAFRLTGVVIHGKGQGGKTLGIPTANLSIDAAPAVPHGVYAARAFVDDQTYPALVNVGIHPTLPDGPPSVEAHLKGFRGNLYGKRIALWLMRYLRPEKRFASVQELRAQLLGDIASLDRA